MRRAMCFVLIVATLISLAACGNPAADGTVMPSSQKTPSASPEGTPELPPEETSELPPTQVQGIPIEEVPDVKEVNNPSIAVYEDGRGTKRAYRMFPYYWRPNEAFEATCEGLLKYKDVVDEIVLFCDNMHSPYMPDDELAEYTTVLKERIAKLKALGFKSVGINMLQTIGHGDYGAGFLATSPYQTAVGYDGLTSTNQACPRAEGFLDYIAHKYTAYAETGPDFIWVDDDFRTPDKTVDYLCFCVNCIDTFNKQYGTNYTRETLVEGLEHNDETGQQLRQTWSSYNLDANIKVMQIVGDAVRKVDPKIKMGLMVVHLQANAYILSDYQGMAEALGAEMIRPGGGVYTETSPMDILGKIFGVSHQVAQLANVVDRQYELEDFPQTNYKSAKMHMLECTAALMAGCNAIAFASIPPDQGNDYVMTAIRDFDDCWNDMVRTGDGWKLYGGTAIYDSKYAIYSEPGHYFSKAAHYEQNTEMTPFNYGFMSYTPYEENSLISVLSQDIVLSLDDEQIKDIFSKGVMLDGKAASLLVDRGYGDLLGIKRVSYMTNSAEERYVDHPLNGNAVGTMRYTYGYEYYSFSLLDGAEPLCTAEAVNGIKLGTTSYVYENDLGGRVVVYGYMPWEYFNTWQRMEQTKNICQWLAKDQLPVVVENSDNIVSFIKQPEDRSKFMLMLINAFLDDTAESLEVKVLGEYSGDMIYYNEGGEKSTIPAKDIVVADGYTTIKLPQLTGWGFGVLYTQG